MHLGPRYETRDRSVSGAALEREKIIGSCLTLPGLDRKRARDRAPLASTFLCRVL
jgi:hypothetical protein